MIYKIGELRKMTRDALVTIINQKNPARFENDKAWIACWTKQDMVDEIARMQGTVRRFIHPKVVAVWHTCPGVINDGDYGHSMRDYCGNCAPFWGEYPVCPVHNKRITATTGFCKAGRHFVDLSKKEAV